MPSPTVPTLAFVGWLVIQWICEVHTTFFQKRYFASVFSFLASGLIALALAYTWIVETTRPSFVVAILFGIVGVFFLGLFVAKLTIAPDTQYLKPKYLLRGLTFFDAACRDFSVADGDKGDAWARKHRDQIPLELETKDHVKIRGVLISSGHRNVIIVAHGALRSKNTLPYVMVAQWLANKYDVIAFDFRGHGESGGYHDFSDAPVQDLQRVIQFARERYEKIGVFGRSMGAWVALLEAAKYHDVDSIVAAAAPLRQITDLKFARLTRRIIQIPLLGVLVTPVAQMLVKIVRGTRMNRIKDAEICPIDVAGQIAPIPVFLIYQEYDTVIETNAQDARTMFNTLKGEKDLMILAGPGHIFELSQFHRMYTLVESWFDRTLGNQSSPIKTN